MHTPLSRIILVLVALSILMATLPLHITTANPSAQTWYVSSSGNDGNSCLTQFSPCRTILAALNKAANGDTIFVGTGIYIERFTITKNITIRGASSTATIIDGANGGRILDVPANRTVTLSDLTLKNGWADSANGGAIRNNGTLTLYKTTLSNNRSYFGGAIYNNGQITVQESILRDNTTDLIGGSGIANDGNAIVTGSTISNNFTFGQGGGFTNSGINATAMIINSTITNNQANNSGGGFSNNGILTIQNSTITNNKGVVYGGGGILGGTNGSIRIRNSIVAYNTGNTAETNCKGPIISEGNNMVNDGSCNFTSSGDRNNTDPLLNPLANNGGPTPTQSFYPVSPARNAGSNTNCPSTDQRGVTRPQQGVCDIGAFEYAPTTPRGTVVIVHGWQGLDSQRQFYCKKANGSPNITHYQHEPLTNNDDPSFINIANWLVQDGYDVWLAHIETGPQSTAPLYDNSKCLREQIAIAAGNGKVIVVAHSMGGLVTRRLIENPGKLNGQDFYQNNVQSLFTLGTPHEGVPVDGIGWCTWALSFLSNINCANQLGLYEFATLNYAPLYQLNPRVNYYFVGGDLPTSDSTTTGNVVRSYIPGADDGIVPLVSSVPSDAVRGKLNTNEGHASVVSKNQTYFIPRGGSSFSTSYTSCIRPALNNQSCYGAAITSDKSQPVSPDDYAVHIPVTKGSIVTNQTDTRTVYIDGGKTLFASAWITGTMQFTLQSPTGQIIDPAYAAANPTVVQYEQTNQSGSSTYATYSFPNAQSGTWTMRIRGLSVPGSTQYMFVGAMDGSITIQTAADKGWYSQGSQAVITATLTGSPISANVQSIVTLPTGTTHIVNLIPQGGGLYQASYTIPSVAGSYSVQTRAFGEVEIGTDYEREAMTGFQVAPTSAALAGTYNEQAVDASGDGLYEKLVINVGVTTNVTGTFVLKGELKTSGGQTIAYATSTYELPITGSQTMALEFDGDDIRDGGINGPYTLTNLTLLDNRRVLIPVQEAFDVYTTQAYDHMLFGSRKVYLPVVLK